MAEESNNQTSESSSEQGSSFGLAGASVVSSLINMWAVYENSRIMRKEYELRAKIAKWQAKDALARGRVRETRVRGGIKKIVGTQRAAMAAQGISLGFGSAQDVVQETQDVGEVEAMTVKLNAIKEAYGYKTAAISGSYGARMAQIGGYQELGETLLTGGLQAYYYYNR